MNATSAGDREFLFTDSDFQWVANKIYESTGITLAPHKKDMVYSRLVRRIRDLGIESFTQYTEYVNGSGSADEMVNFVNALTTNLTRFFRESHHFSDLKEYLEDRVLKQKVSRLRLWSSASSSGQEPYSIAMVLREVLDRASHKIDAKILATDIDTNMLTTGQSGIYAIDECDQVPKFYLKKYTIPNNDDGTCVMKDELKNLITFKSLNLIKSWPIKGPFDAVFCRNVIIYFDKGVQKEIFKKMAAIMPADSRMYIGHSEMLHGVSNDFELIGRTIYRRK